MLLLLAACALSLPPAIDLAVVHHRPLVVAVEAPGFQDMMQSDPTWGRRWTPALDMAAVEASVARGVTERLGPGVQLAVGADRLEIDIVEGGIRAPAMGSGGELYLTLTAQLIPSGEERGPKRRLRCSSASAPPLSPPRMIAEVIRGDQLSDWTDAQLQQAVESMAWWCGAELASRLLTPD